MCPSLSLLQVNTNTPDSVFQVLAYLKELLLILHHDYILPALAYASQLLQRAWEGLQDSCKSVVLFTQTQLPPFQSSTVVVSTPQRNPSHVCLG